MDLKTRESRIQYGFEGELAVKQYFSEYGIKLHHNIVDAEDDEGRKNQIFSNMKRGDLVYSYGENGRELFKFDVKRGQIISEKSLRFFRGQFFILIPEGNIEDIENSRVIWRRTAENYINKATEGWTRKYVQLQSGDKGYRFLNKLRRETTLSDFVNRLVKFIIMNPSSIEISQDLYKTFYFGSEDEQV